LFALSLSLAVCARMCLCFYSSAVIDHTLGSGFWELSRRPNVNACTYQQSFVYGDACRVLGRHECLYDIDQQCLCAIWRA